MLERANATKVIPIRGNNRESATDCHWENVHRNIHELSILCQMIASNLPDEYLVAKIVMVDIVRTTSTMAAENRNIRRSGWHESTDREILRLVAGCMRCFREPELQQAMDASLIERMRELAENISKAVAQRQAARSQSDEGQRPAANA